MMQFPRNWTDIAAMEFYMVPHAEATVVFSNNCNCKIWNQNLSPAYSDMSVIIIIGTRSNPKRMETANVLPIFKKGDKSKASN